MKLLSHNMLTSRCIKGVQEGYPLGIVATDIKISTIDFNSEFVSRIIPKLDYKTLWTAANTIGHSDGLPNDLETDFDTNEEFLRKMHHVLLEIEIVTGELVCPETGRKFPITKGIPNMLLTEAEV